MVRLPVKYNVIYIVTISVILMFHGCGRSAADVAEVDSNVVDSTITVAEDSVEQPEDKKKPSLSFSTAADAIAYMDQSPNSARYRAGILHQMSRDNLNYAAKLLNNEHDYFVVVDKRRMKVCLFDKYGVEVKTYGMACARNYGSKHRKGDSRTSEGFFSAQGIYDSTDWLYTDDNGHTSKAKGVYGPRFIRLLIPGVWSIGIHGTNAPWSIGHRTSHGCIRLVNDNILDLVKYVKEGTPIIVSPGSRDMAVNRREGYNIPAVNTDLYDIVDVNDLPSPNSVKVSDAKIENNPSANPSSEENTGEELKTQEQPILEEQKAEINEESVSTGSE